MFVFFRACANILEHAGIKSLSIDGACVKHKVFKYDQLVLEGRTGKMYCVHIP